MKLLDYIKRKILNIPLFGSRTTSLSSLFSSSKTNHEYYTGWVYSCVRAIAEEVANMKLTLYRSDSAGNVEQVSDHPSLTLLEKVNEFMTMYDLFERLQSNLELGGNEFWFLQYGKGNVPERILPLNPASVSVVPGVYEYVAAYKYRVNGESFDIPPKNIIQFKNFNPKSDILGMGTLEACRLAADTDFYAREYNKQYFQNSARPDVILEYPETLSPEDEKRLLTAWHNEHGGPQRQFKTAVASGGLKISTFQISHRDMEFLAQRQFSRDEILAIFRVPGTVIGIVNEATYASAKAANYSFGLRTITPKMQRIVNTLNEFFLPLYGDPSLFFEFDSPVQEDRDLILREYDMGIKNGWLSINDVRRSEGLPEVQNGEAVMIPFSVTPLGEPVEGKAIAQPPITKMAAEIAEAIIKSLPEPKAEEPKKPELTEEQKKFERLGEYRTKARNERGLEYERAFNKKLKELWSGQIKRANENLKEFLNRKDWKVKVPDLLDEKKELKITIDLMGPLFVSITELEGEASLEFLGLPDETIVLTPRLRKAIEANTKKFAGEVTKVTSNAIRATIAAGLENGEALRDLEKRITNLTSFSPARAETIARTETIRAQTFAEQEVWRDSGVVEGKVWYTALDERTCPYCESMHGKTVSLNESYFNKGDSLETEEGTLKLDYETVIGPPLHPSCRCVLIPDVSTKMVRRPAPSSDEVFRHYLKSVLNEQADPKTD